MPTWTDCRIFVSGVTQYAMSSGKFEAEQIHTLADEAFQAFIRIFGQPDGEGAPSQPRYAPPPQRAAMQPAYQVPVPPAAPQSGGGEPGLVDGKPWRMWSGDKIGLGKNSQGPHGKMWSDVTWAEAYQSALGGGKKTLGYLDFLSNLKDSDPKWTAKNAILRARASSVLAAAAGGNRSQAEANPQHDETPF